jgi:hypothetical protein
VSSAKSRVREINFSAIYELQIKTVIDHDFKELDEWSKKWLMTFNSDKTEIMLFSNTDIPEFNFTFKSEEDDLFINTLYCRYCR